MHLQMHFENGRGRRCKEGGVMGIGMGTKKGEREEKEGMERMEWSFFEKIEKEKEREGQAKTYLILIPLIKACLTFSYFY